ncbi:MAG: HipA domain-containing protein, partial [Beijerinckiaceae bacterium]
RAWFDNLVQENDSLAEIMARERIDRTDIVSLLAVIGADCPGAISCLPEDAPPAKRPGVLIEDYDPIPEGEIMRLATALADTGRPPRENPDPSPVAGYQPKIAITRLPDGRFALPKPGSHAPTTHILKVPRRRDENDALVEAACMGLATDVDILAAQVEVVDIGGVRGLLIERFDRHVTEGQVHRLHQEDFAQALGLPANLKYEYRGGPAGRFDISGVARILRATATPAREIERFIHLTLFNLVIGNVDNHAKNHALLYLGGQPMLAPAYDLLATRLNHTLTDQFAFRIGAAEKLQDVARGDLLAFAQALGLRGRGAERILESAARHAIAPLVDETMLDMIAKQESKPLADHISHAARHLAEAMGWNWLHVPVRDAFGLRGGGWLTS